MLGFIKKLFKPLDDAAKRLKTKCTQCGHEMTGVPHTCEKCGAALESSRD